MSPSEPTTLLEIADLKAGYGSVKVLHGVQLRVGAECVGIIGRNGMGKTTLCKAIMGMVRATGSIRLGGRELVGLPSYKIARSGVGYVPQGRRVFGSLTTSEHLRMLGRPRGEWTVDRVYELFPRLALRRNSGAERLSGGEQQMLAIARALLTNPRVLIMDEPSEGLAPAVVDEVIEICAALAGAGMGLIVVEQNLRVAAALADRLAVLVLGTVAAELSAAELLADQHLQQRYLGIAPMEASA